MAYLRANSTSLRWFNEQLIDVEDDDSLEVTGPTKTLFVLVTRTQQRMLQKYFDAWIKNSSMVEHDYTDDLRKILRQSLDPTEPRSELELEAIYRWARRSHSADPSGIQYVIKNCQCRASRIALMQDMRLEIFRAGDVILCQGEQPKPCDGHITVLSGQLEMFKFPKDSKQLTWLLEATAQKQFDRSRALFARLPCVGTLLPGSGFGQLCSSYLSPWNISVNAHRENERLTRVLIVSQAPYLECLQSLSGDGLAVDFLRSTGFSRLLSAADLLATAAAMEHFTLQPHEIVFTNQTPAASLFFLFHGEVLADVGDPGKDSEEPFTASQPSNCYIMHPGSMLGDEAFLGQGGCYASSCMSLTTTHLFRVSDAATLQRLSQLLCLSRTSALVNRDNLRFTSVHRHLNEINIYSNISSLRQSISFRNQFRGVASNAWRDQRVSPRPNSAAFTSQLSKHSIRRLESLLKAVKKIEGALKIQVAQDSLLSSELDFEVTGEIPGLAGLEEHLRFDRHSSAAVPSRIGVTDEDMTGRHSSQTRIDEYYTALKDLSVPRGATALGKTLTFSPMMSPAKGAGMMDFLRLFKQSAGKKVPQLKLSGDGIDLSNKDSSEELPRLSQTRARIIRSSHSPSRRGIGVAQRSKSVSAITNTVKLAVPTPKTPVLDILNGNDDAKPAKIAIVLPGQKAPPLRVKSAKPAEKVISSAMLQFQEVITADQMSQRGKYITGKKARASLSKYSFDEVKHDPHLHPSDADIEITKWKEYCISAAVKFKKDGRLSMPVLEHRKCNPSSFKWSNTLYLTTPASAYGAEHKPLSYLKAYQERYTISKRPPLEAPKSRTAGASQLGLKID